MNNSQPNNDPLDRLFVDREELDRQLLSDLILPYARLQRNTTELITTDEWRKLTLPKKVLIYLLARKVLVSASVITAEEEATSPAQIEKDTDMSGGSIRPTLSRLVDDKFVRQEKNTKGYFVPNHALYQIAKLFKSEEKAK